MSLSNSSLRYCILATCALLCAASGVRAQSAVRINDAQATVDLSSGRINWYAFNPVREFLSTEQKSYVYFKFNGDPNKVFTNHDLAPVPDITLPTGEITRRGPAGRDTITYTWKKTNGVDIMQDVFGVDAGAGKGQIITRWRFFNSGGNTTEISTQYLLDANVKTDNSKTLTRHGYRSFWTQYTRGQIPDVPPFFINFEKDLPNAPTFDLGLSGMGYMNRPEWGIQAPWRMTITHWPTQERVPWGPESPLPSTPISDNAILMEWDGVTVPPGKEVMGPSFSYGTGDYFSCNGKLFSLIFFPRKLEFDPILKTYSPNPFDVEVYLFNPEKTTSASNVSMTLEVGDKLNIVGSTDPKKETVTPNPSSIPPEGVTIHTWKVKADLNQPCTGPFIAEMFLSAQSSLGPPALFECIPQVELPCTERDLLPPLVDNVVGSEPNLVQSFDVSDNRTEDRGLQKIDHVFTIGDPANFDVQIGTIDPCTKLKVPVVVRQLDSTKGGCLTFTFTDCAGNFNTREMCFMVHDTVAIPDTFAPVFELIQRVGSYDGTDCNSLRDSIEVTELRPHDEGLASLVLTPGIPPQNMRLVSAPITNQFRHAFSVEVIDRFQNGSISVTATDLAGNKDTTEYTYCTIPDVLAPRISYTKANHTWTITVQDSLHWDRLIDQITLTGLQNFAVNPMPTAALTSGKPVFKFDLTIIDTTKAAGVCIVATDLAGNKSGEFCPTSPQKVDSFPPAIALTPPASTNPWKVTVNINDIHYLNKDTLNGRIPYDTGIQEVWFTNVTGMSIGMPDRTFSPTVAQVPLFEIFVIDTNDAINETACVTIHARDSANNFNTLTYCYPIKGDTLAPVITGVAANYDELDLLVTDEELVDRGLRRIEMLSSDNFEPFGPVQVSGDKSYAVKLRLDNNGKSAVGRIQAMDMWGSNATRPEIKALHTSAVDLYMWVQPFEMKKSHLIKQSGQFMLPVTFAKNDENYTIEQKGINKYDFSFRITGDPQVTFVGVQTDNTSSLGWNVNPIVTNGGRDVRIVGTAPTGEVMKSSDSSIVVKLIFTGAESEFSKSALIEIDTAFGRSLVLNDGQQTTVVGQGNANAILPAPQGSINGASIVVAGFCTPLVTNDPALQGSTIAMGAITPNPVTDNARVIFAMPKTAQANLKLYNAVGEAVRTLTEGELEAGSYEQLFETTGLASGTYYLRLESEGQVVSRAVKIAR
ncbi:MAG TPA: T9SS type A sorting domain-containing protein [Candidatus Kapabacteria bacterium]|nr:T9SS type A sorting domain-containing protein [Candidatus Kapabacteria bacterium]